MCFWYLRLSYSCSQVFSVSFCLNSGLALKKKKKNMQTNIPLNHKLLFCILPAIIPLFKLYYSLQSGHAVWKEALRQIKGSYSEKRPFTTEGSELKQTRNPSFSGFVSEKVAVNLSFNHCSVHRRVLLCLLLFALHMENHSQYNIAQTDNVCVCVCVRACVCVCFCVFADVIFKKIFCSASSHSPLCNLSHH